MDILTLSQWLQNELNVVEVNMKQLSELELESLLEIVETIEVIVLQQEH